MREMCPNCGKPTHSIDVIQSACTICTWVETYERGRKDERNACLAILRSNIMPEEYDRIERLLTRRS